MKKNYLLLFLLVFSMQYVAARITTEDFEAIPPAGPTHSFASGTATFNLTSTYTTFPAALTIDNCAFEAEAVAPTVTTATPVAANIGAVRATLGGEVTAGELLTAKGIVWSTAAITTTPTLSNNVSTHGTTSTDAFSGLVTGLPPSTLIYYRAYATNNDGTSYGAVYSFTTNAALNATQSQTDVKCNGVSDGNATVTPSGGKTPYTYAWSPSGGTGATANNLGAGQYDVTITDGDLTTLVKTFDIEEPALALTASTASTGVSCFGGSNGTASVTASNGTFPYTYAWAPLDGNSSSISGRPAGDYTCTITDANGCTLVKDITISSPAQFSASVTKNDVSCNGGSNGTATITPSGATAPFTYTWTPTGGSNATASGLSAGTYNVIVQDANTCQYSIIITIDQPDPLTATSSQINACPGGSNGEASVIAKGGTAPYTYIWSPAGGTADTATGLTAGNYSVLITDSNGCFTTRSFTIINTPDNSAPIPDLLNLPDITGYCSLFSSEITVPTATDNCAGTINATTTDPLNYTATGNYSITWTYDDGNGNITTQTQNVIVLDSPLDALTFTDKTVTYNGNVQTIELGNLPSDAIVTYSITPATTTPNGALDAGNYTVTALVFPGVSAPNCVPVILSAQLTIEKAAQQITFEPLGDRILGTNNTFTLNATSNSGLPITYTYTYTTALSSATVSATGEVELLRAGEITITASQAGDDNYLPAVGVSQLLFIKNDVVVPSMTNLPDITGYCSVFSSEITVPTALGSYTGTITATTTDPLDYTSTGNYSITWTYDAGNGNIITQTQNVIVLDSPLDLLTFTDKTVTYNGNVQTVEVGNLPADALVTYSITPATTTPNGALDAGNYTVTALVFPSVSAPNCVPVILSAQLTIEKAAQQITFEPLGDRILGTNNTFTLNATSNSGLPVTYTYTYTTALPSATVSATGEVELLRAGEITITASQAGDDNYLPAVAVSQLLFIKNDDVVVSSITIGGTVYANPPKEIKYVMGCDEDSFSIGISNQTNATITPAPNFTVTPPKPGIYTENAVVTSQDGSTSSNYTITIEKPFSFFDVVQQKFNNVLLVNNNPATNGGYEFTSYEWFKNGVSVGTGQYYSAGENITDELDITADYKVKMKTKEGQILQTCNTTVEFQKSFQAKLYPNPTQTGKVITVEADLPKEELEKMQISLYSVSGKLIKTIQSSTVKTEIQLPPAIESNMYLVVIETANIKKSLKVIVNK